jgi:hypothetical protein
MIEKYPIESLILKTKFKHHNKFKKQILKYFKEANDESYKIKDDYFNDKLIKTDWPKADNWERPWIKYSVNELYEQLNIFAQELGYQETKLHKMWYQQYDYNDVHNWHIHDGSYTGTYYVEYSKDCPTTQFLYPNNLNKSFTINVEEGDIIFFPCFFIHRSAVSKSKKRKSIISWNVDFKNIKQEYIDNPLKVDILKKK